MNPNPIWQAAARALVDQLADEIEAREGVARDPTVQEIADYCTPERIQAAQEALEKYGLGGVTEEEKPE